MIHTDYDTYDIVSSTNPYRIRRRRTNISIPKMVVLLVGTLLFGFYIKFNTEMKLLTLSE